MGTVGCGHGDAPKWCGGLRPNDFHTLVDCVRCSRVSRIVRIVENVTLVGIDDIERVLHIVVETFQNCLGGQ